MEQCVGERGGNGRTEIRLCGGGGNELPREREREAHFEQVNIIPERAKEGESRCIEGWLLGLQ